MKAEETMIEIERFDSAQAPCSIDWPAGALTAQLVDNYVRFLLDFCTLIFIMLVSGHLCLTATRLAKDLTMVYAQLALLLIAQILYCIRSSSRIYESDDTYFGTKTPQWTKSCENAGNVVNFMQHWMYCTSYLYVALCFRLAFNGIGITH